MSFRCPACSDKSYDKAWKLQRHVRESKKCFERINPGMPANYFVRFQCFSCGYASPREPDLDRHRRRVHGETDNPIASGLHSTSSADASTEDDINVISDLSQPENPHDLLFQSKSSSRMRNITAHPWMVHTPAAYRPILRHPWSSLHFTAVNQSTRLQLTKAPARLNGSIRT